MFLIFFLGILYLIYIILLFYKSEKKKFGDWVLQRFLQMNFYAVELNEFIFLYEESKNYEISSLDMFDSENVEMETNDL